MNKDGRSDGGNPDPDHVADLPCSHGVPNEKRSLLNHGAAWRGGQGAGVGAEAGARARDGDVSRGAPLRWVELAPGARGAPVVRARALLEEIEKWVPEELALTVEVHAAETSELTERGETCAHAERWAASLHVGGQGVLPAWSRSVWLDGSEGGWPPGWPSVLARHLSGWTRGLPTAHAEAGEDWLVDVFPLADLLRTLAVRWLRRAPVGQTIAREGVVIDERGDLPGSLAGAPESPARRPLVTGGRFVGPASEDLPPSWGSWRSAPRRLYRGLALSAPPAPEPLELRSGILLTEVHELGGHLIGGGVRLERGASVARVAHVALGESASLLGALGAALGEEVSDGAGLPVVTPAMDLPGWSPRAEEPD